MNGRVYDYNVGRFMSVDPFIQGSGSQGVNPYSYVMNNPLSFTDPSGYSAETVEVDKDAQVYKDSDGNNYVDAGDGSGDMIKVDSVKGTYSNGATKTVSFSSGGRATSVATTEIGSQANVPKSVGGEGSEISFENGINGSGSEEATNPHGKVINATFSFGEGETLSYDVLGTQEFADTIAEQMNEIVKTAAGRNMLSGIAGSDKRLLIMFGKKPAEGIDKTGMYGSVMQYDHKTPQFMRTSTSGERVNTDPIYNILAHELHHSWRRMTSIEGSWYESKSYTSNDIGRRVPGLSDWEPYAVRHTNLIRKQAGLGYRRTHYRNDEGREFRVD
jgi:hypothetical protein